MNTCEAGGDGPEKVCEVLLFLEGSVVLVFSVEVEMIFQSHVMESDASAVSMLSLAPDGSAVIVRFTLRVWSLVLMATRRGDQSWKRSVSYFGDGVLIRIPLVRMGTATWQRVVHDLSALQRMVSVLQLQKIEALGNPPFEQLVWIDALVLDFWNSDIGIAASPRFAAFVRTASPEVFERVSATVRRAEAVVTGDADVPQTRGASQRNGALHLSVGGDCACLGVPWNELPTPARRGWPAHGHNLRSSAQVFLILVALAALEDECRASIVGAN